jgi:hypothetical protein
MAAIGELCLMICKWRRAYAKKHVLVEDLDVFKLRAIGTGGKKIHLGKVSLVKITSVG